MRHTTIFMFTSAYRYQMVNYDLNVDHNLNTIEFGHMKLYKIYKIQKVIRKGLWPCPLLIVNETFVK